MTAACLGGIVREKGMSIEKGDMGMLWWDWGLLEEKKEAVESGLVEWTIVSSSSPPPKRNSSMSFL